jgi:hypothetical protein
MNAGRFNLTIGDKLILKDSLSDLVITANSLNELLRKMSELRDDLIDCGMEILKAKIK